MLGVQPNPNLLFQTPCVLWASVSFARGYRIQVSMPEMPHPGTYHRHTMLVGRRNGLFVAHRATGLDHRDDAGLGGVVDAVAEREEGV